MSMLTQKIGLLLKAVKHKIYTSSYETFISGSFGIQISNRNRYVGKLLSEKQSRH